MTQKPTQKPVQGSSPNPTWYDLLGLGRDASPAEIKAAWRDATDKFEPGSGTSQFRLFNEAADVLLDPARRAAYDAELGGSAATSVAEAPAPPAPPVEVSEVPEAEPEVEDVATDAAVEPEVEDTATEPVIEPPTPPPAPPPPATSGGTSAVDRLGERLGWVLAVCVPVLVASLVATVIAIFGLHVWKVDVQGIVPAVRTANAGPDASAAAEDALKAVLSYDYRHMEADRGRAVQFLTPRYKKDYLKTFNDLLAAGPNGTPGPVVKTKAVVTADVLNTGVSDASSNRVRVIVFVNQSSVKGTAAPTIFQNRVVATMVRSGDRWLLDGITSY